MSDGPKKPLNSLLPKLSENWEFLETGKAYWIGYTKDMFSIAAYGDSAVGPLLTLVDTTSVERARIGAIYTLHLIGINRTIAGRFMEKFVDSNARGAMLSLLKYPELQSTIMSLLTRDPWRSDVPRLFEMMMSTDESCWAIGCGLLHYNLANPPVDQELPEALSHLYISLKNANFRAKDPTENIEAQMHAALDSIVALKSDLIEVEQSLFEQKLYGYSWFNPTGRVVAVSEYLKTITPETDRFSLSYINLGYRIHYYAQEGKVYICSAATAKRRWIAWWLAYNKKN